MDSKKTLFITFSKMENNEQLQIEIQSISALLICNSIQYAIKCFKIWSSRLKSGIYREAFKYPNMITPGQTNRMIYGQLSQQNITDIKRSLRYESSYNDITFGQFELNQYQFYNYDALENWRDLYVDCKIPIDQIPSIESSISSIQIPTIMPALSTINQLLTSLTPQHAQIESFRTSPQLAVFQQIQKTSKKTQQRIDEYQMSQNYWNKYFQVGEQQRFKSQIEYKILTSEKLFNHIYQLYNKFNPMGNKYKDFSSMISQFRAAIDPITNTIIRDNQQYFYSLQLYQSDQDAEFLDLLNIRDTASIAVEQLIYQRLFPKIFQRGKKEFEEQDKNYYKMFEDLQNEEYLQIIKNKQKTNILDLSQSVTVETDSESCPRSFSLLAELLSIPSKLLDPTGFELPKQELIQLDQRQNIGDPRSYLHGLLDVAVSIQMTVNCQTKEGIKTIQTAAEQHNDIYSTSIGADEFLPIFVFVLIQSKMENAYTILKIMELCCDERVYSDELGYYLVVFRASLEHTIILNYMSNVRLVDIQKQVLKCEFSSIFQIQQPKKIQNFHMLNLRAMILSLEVINQELQTQQEQFQFTVENVPYLTQPYNIKELLYLSKVAYKQSQQKKQQVTQLDQVIRDLSQFFKDNKELVQKIQQQEQDQFLFPVNLYTIAYRFRISQQQSQNFSKQIKKDYNPKPLINSQKFKELYEAVEELKYRQFNTFQQLYEQIPQQLQIQIEPYHDVNDVFTDVIIMLQNLYMSNAFTKNKLLQFLQQFVKFFQNKKIIKKQAPDYIKNCLTQENIKKINHIIKSTEFDTIDFSVWSQQSILTVLSKLRITQTNQTREDISDSAMDEAIKYIQEQKNNFQQVQKEQEDDI